MYRVIHTGEQSIKLLYILHVIDKITHFWCSSHILSLWQYWSRGYQGPLKKSCAQLCKKSPGKKNRFIKRPYKIQLSILYIKKQGYRVCMPFLLKIQNRTNKKTGKQNILLDTFVMIL